MFEIAGMGLDYLRFNIFSELDLEYISKLLPYVDIYQKHFHGYAFVDLTGSQLELVRMFDSVDRIALMLSQLYRCTRIDVFIDVVGAHLGKVKALGTEIRNNGKTETIYSHHLKMRGNAPVFCRAYDARAAGHYSLEVTRFECEYKRESARAILGESGWKVDPINAALYSIEKWLDVHIDVPGHAKVEFHAPQKRFSHGREKFYSRYGNSIANDIEQMGVEGLYDYILECLSEKRSKRG